MGNDEPDSHGGRNGSGKLQRVPHQPRPAPPLPPPLDTERDTKIAGTGIPSELHALGDVTGSRACTWNDPRPAADDPMAITGS